MKIVLIGKNGQLGWELQRSLPVFGEVFALGRDDLDISVPGSISNHVSVLRPDSINKAAAYTEVDLAETRVEPAMQINALAPGVLAELSRRIGAAFIHYSTDY